VLLHGLSGSARWWQPVLPTLAPRFTAYLVELPGLGRQRRHGPVALADTPGWLAGWLEEVGLDRASWVGHSMGGALCIRLAAHHPQVVNRLVLVDAAGVPATASLLGYGVPLARALRAMAPSFLPVLTADALRAGPRTLLRSARQLMREDIRPSLASITAPTLIIWGARDSLVPLSVGHLLHGQITDSRLVILPGAGHVPMYDRPGAFNRALLSFLTDSDNAGSS
jgi:pimeloyl-ACP methyl ester carboxylesterase